MDWSKELSTPIPAEPQAEPQGKVDWRKELAPAAPIREVTKDRLRVMLGATYRTNPEEEAIQEAFPTSFMPSPERPGEMGAFAGELAGTGAALLTGPLAPVTRPILAGIGAGIGSQVERVVRGEPVDRQQAINEAILSFVPEFAESAIRGVSRGIARISRGGQDLRLDEAAKIAKRRARQVFNPPEKKDVARLFDMLDTMDVDNPMRGARGVLSGLDESESKRLMRELNRLDPRATAALVEDGISLTPKQMQNYRSLIGQQAESLRNSGRPGAARTRQVLLEVQRAVDQDIDDILDQVDLGGAAQTAREAYHRLKSADRLERILTTSPVMKSTQGGDIMQFHLDRLDNLLKDAKSKDARALASALDRIPGARQEFEGMRQELKQVLPERVLEITDVSGLRRFAPIAAIDRMLSYILTSKTGQTLFRDAVIYGRGRLSVNQLALIVNAIRRNEMEPGEPTVYIEPGAVSQRRTGPIGGQSGQVPRQPGPGR